MDSLFDENEPLDTQSSNPQYAGSKDTRGNQAHTPLATRMRPTCVNDIIGQDHILGEGKLLRRAIQADSFSSFIFYGPPGTGKTSLASVIAANTNSRFESLNAVESNVADIRNKVDQARHYQDMRAQSTILFIDEIHRFNKSQQDVLLPHIEKGTVRFIGATTENPYYYVNSPLVSRSQIFQLEPISSDSIVRLLKKAITTDPALSSSAITADEDALIHLAQKCDGDARRALSALELALTTTPPCAQADDSSHPETSIHLTLAVAEESIQQKAIVYGAKGDAHYDTISAFIKSIRGSDPDAALYWLAKMLTAGEDPRYIARRLVISASEDIGLADSNALRIAISAQQAFDLVGMPEGRIPLAHATVYLATAPKSNTAYMGINLAITDVKNGATLPVPEHLRTKTRKKIAAQNGATDENLMYFYAHDYPGGYVPQAYLPEGKTYYQAGENGMEKRIKERLEHLKSLHQTGAKTK